MIADGPTPKKARHCGAMNLAAADGSLAGQGAAAAPGGPEAPLRGHRRQGGVEVGRSDGRTVGRSDGRTVGRSDGRTVGRSEGGGQQSVGGFEEAFLGRLCFSLGLCFFVLFFA